MQKDKELNKETETRADGISKPSSEKVIQREHKSRSSLEVFNESFDDDDGKKLESLKDASHRHETNKGNSELNSDGHSLREGEQTENHGSSPEMVENPDMNGGSHKLPQNTEQRHEVNDEEQYVSPDTGSTQSPFEILNAAGETVSEKPSPKSSQDMPQLNVVTDDQGNVNSEEKVSSSQVFVEYSPKKEETERVFHGKESYSMSEAPSGKRMTGNCKDNRMDVNLEDSVEGKYDGEIYDGRGLTVADNEGVREYVKSVDSEAGSGGGLLVAFLAFLAIAASGFVLYSFLKE